MEITGSISSLIQEQNKFSGWTFNDCKFFVELLDYACNGISYDSKSKMFRELEQKIERLGLQNPLTARQCLELLARIQKLKESI